MLLTGLKRVYVGDRELRAIAQGPDVLARKYNQLYPDPSFENTAVGQPPQQLFSAVNCTAAVTNEWAGSGTHSLKITPTLTNSYIFLGPFTVSNSGPVYPAAPCRRSRPAAVGSTGGTRGTCSRGLSAR